MKNKLKAIIPSVIVVIAALFGINLSTNDIEQVQNDFVVHSYQIEKDGSYYSKEDVALYINTYGVLPSNFIKKAEARNLGWQGGTVEQVAPGKAIGGDKFYNNEGSLPEKSGRIYTECDINTLGKDSRGAERIVFSNDGLVYYTANHYETFELLYGIP